MLDDLQSLRSQTNAQLVARWRALGVRGDPPHFKQALVRGLAWHVQEHTHGGLDAETRRLLKEAIRRTTSAGPRERKKNQKKTSRRITLRTGTTLVRTWRGTVHEVTVLDAGKRFRYRGTEYTSLSEIAREITGARWSGPRFFGLTKLGGTG